MSAQQVYDADQPLTGASKIQWTNYTGGPWLICGEVSPGCANCYARELLKRWYTKLVRKAFRRAGFKDWKTRPVWGPKAPRIATKGFREKILALERKAAREGKRFKVFPSMIDWLDEMPAGIIDQDGNWLNKDQVLADFLDLIRLTTNLDWLLLTKRPENWRDRIERALIKCQGGDPDDKDRFTKHGDTFPEGDLANWLNDWTGNEPPANVWIGCTVENQEYADLRIPQLLKIPAVCRFISYEPALGPVSFKIKGLECTCDNCLGSTRPCSFETLNPNDWSCRKAARGIHWIIVGGESGPKARPFNIEWARSTVAQCKAASVACFVKQLGAKPIESIDNPNPPPTEQEELNFKRAGFCRTELTDGRVVWQKWPKFADGKGGDISEWPEDLRVRQFPWFADSLIRSLITAQ